MKRIFFLIPLLMLGACDAIPTIEPTATISKPFVIRSVENSFSPRPEDGNLQIGGVEIASMDLSEITNVEPTRVQLTFLGSMPRACNELRINVSPPDEQFQIQVEIYSLVDTKVECENVFQQFEASVLLGVYSPGRYTVWVNGGLIGDFVTY